MLLAFADCVDATTHQYKETAVSVRSFVLLWRLLPKFDVFLALHILESVLLQSFVMLPAAR